MRCIAHRGFAEEYSENTLTAVRAAAERADAVEVDVRRYGSGELVVVHDETVDRVTDGTGTVAELTAEELAALDVLGSGDGIPTLADVLAAAGDTELVLDLKETGVTGDALDRADDAGGEVVVSSTHASVLRAAREQGADRLAYVSAEDDEQGILNVARTEGCTAVHPHWQLCVGDFVDRAQEAGLAVNAWTVPSRRDAAALADVGVDGVIVDRAEVCPE